MLLPEPPIQGGTDRFQLRKSFLVYANPSRASFMLT